tara:strand:- start:14638 stop:15174 length:537 start_codon:yes stop_codon:yes gene_type:complete
MSARSDRGDASRFDDGALRGELRQAWSDLRAPAPDADVDAPDELAAAVNDWMRAAWTSLEAPELPTQARFAPRSADPIRRSTLLRLLPSALAALGTAAAVVLIVRFIGTPVQRPEPPTPQVAHAQPTVRPRIDGSIEMRSGNVRLILVPPAVDDAAPTHFGTEAAGAHPEPPSETLSR